LFLESLLGLFTLKLFDSLLETWKFARGFWFLFNGSCWFFLFDWFGCRGGGIELCDGLGDWCRTFGHGVHQIGSCLWRILNDKLLLALLLSLELFALLVLEIELFRFFLRFLFGLFILSGDIFPLLLSLEFSCLFKFLLHLVLFFFQGLSRDWFLGISFSTWDWWHTANKSLRWHLLCSKWNTTSSWSLLLLRLIDFFGLGGCLSLSFGDFVFLRHQLGVCALRFGTCKYGDNLGCTFLFGRLFYESLGLKVCWLLGLFFEGLGIQLGSEITLALWRHWSRDLKRWNCWCRSWGSLWYWFQDHLRLDDKLIFQVLFLCHEFLLQCLGHGSDKSGRLVKNSWGCCCWSLGDLGGFWDWCLGNSLFLNSLSR